MSRNRTRKEREQFDRGQKIFLIASGTVIVGYFLYVLVFGDLGLVRYFALQTEQEGVTEEIQWLEKENVRLRGESEALKTDPETIERLARERLGLVRNGERVYQFSNP
jgi:cell division protein FtsB